MTRLLFALATVGLAFFLAAPPAVAQNVTADDYVELFKPLVGTWKSVITTDGKTLEGRITFRLSRTNKCLVSYGEGGPLPATETIQGYDPVAKQWKFTEYDADGGYTVTAIVIKDMKKGKTLGTDYCATSEVVRHSKDGKKTIGTDTVKITVYEKDRIEAVVTDRKEDGKAQPDMKLVLERQQRRVRGAKR